MGSRAVRTCHEGSVPRTGPVRGQKGTAFAGPSHFATNARQTGDAVQRHSLRIGTMRFGRGRPRGQQSHPPDGRLPDTVAVLDNKVKSEISMAAARRPVPEPARLAPQSLVSGLFPVSAPTTAKARAQQRLPAATCGRSRIPSCVLLRSRLASGSSRCRNVNIRPVRAAPAAAVPALGLPQFCRHRAGVNAGIVAGLMQGRNSKGLRFPESPAARATRGGGGPRAWCPGRESNPHTVRSWCLRPLRLPFRHPGPRRV